MKASKGCNNQTVRYIRGSKCKCGLLSGLAHAPLLNMKIMETRDRGMLTNKRERTRTYKTGEDGLDKEHLRRIHQLYNFSPSLISFVTSHLFIGLAPLVELTLITAI